MDHHMKKILLSSVALLGLSAAAFAADLPSRRAAPAPYVAVPVFTWTGFYVGVNAGYGFSDNDRNGLGSYNATAGSLSAPLGGYAGTVTTDGLNNRDNSGFVGGGQIGYNYQIGQWVIGVEADLQYADLNKNDSNGIVVLSPGVTPGTFTGARNANFGGIDWFGTVRGRLGYAMDRFMIYGTGGFAFGGADNNTTDGFDSWRTHNDSTRTGYAAGGGIEYAFTPNLTGKIEGLYVNLERNRDNGFIGTYTAGGVVTPIYTTATGRRNNDSDFAVIRAGLNWKFNAY
jgi:outer membrane immunogenic protein